MGKSVGRLLALETSNSDVGNSLWLGLLRLAQQPFGNGVGILIDSGLKLRENEICPALILLCHLGVRVVWWGSEGLEGSNEPTQIRTGFVWEPGSRRRETNCTKHVISDHSYHQKIPVISAYCVERVFGRLWLTVRTREILGHGTLPYRPLHLEF